MVMIERLAEGSKNLGFNRALGAMQEMFPTTNIPGIIDGVRQITASLGSNIKIAAVDALHRASNSGDQSGVWLGLCIGVLVGGAGGALAGINY